MRLPIVLFSVTAAATSPAHAAEPISVPAFQSVQLRGGGELVVRYGPVQRVTLVEGNSAVTRFTVEEPGTRRIGRNTFNSSEDGLVISACENRCPRNYKLKVEIVTPTLAGLSIHGGGRIAAVGNFPQQKALGLAVHGGGLIDARTMPAAAVGAAINGGGLINTHAVQSLGASINGGGAIRYWGNPSTGVNINGGGTVTRGR